MTTYYRLGDTICEELHVRATGGGGTSPWTPVVVIDPEDREQVERLARELMETTDRLQAALREFAKPTPPKPEEPTGLGALVRDDEGDLWLRDGRALEGYPWTRISDTSGAGASKPTHEAYKHVAAVEVIFEGVTA